MRSSRVPWWPGSVVSEGGLHLHHVVWGIVAMMGAGVISFALLDTGWWYEVCAFVFGIGMGLTIDEFALWVYLDDVYWSREGRTSIDATLIAAAFMGLILLGGVSIDVNAASPFDVIGTVLLVITMLALSTICFLKQRAYHGAVALLVVPLGIYGAVRIGKPAQRGRGATTALAARASRRRRSGGSAATAARSTSRSASAMRSAA
jgi:hypothetical protein